MEIYVAFPQAAPASKFPLCMEVQGVRKRVREFMVKEVAPIMTEAEFPFHIIPKFGALGVVGGSIKVIVSEFLFVMWDGAFQFLFFYLVLLLSVMAVLTSPSQPMQLQQRKYLELMRAVGLLIRCIPLWACSLLETLLNLLLCYHQHYNLYGQAEKFRSKAQRFGAHSNQHVYLLVVILSYQLVIVAFKIIVYIVSLIFHLC